MAALRPQAPAQATRWQLELFDEQATNALAAEVSHFLKPGDLITLSGDLGAGKTTFARALIRRLLGDPRLDVPSPTFTLMQTYEGARYPIVHADLYRIAKPEELAELGWDEAGEGALVLVEWPERAGPDLLAERLDIAFRLDAARGDDYRAVTLTGFGSFAGRLTLIHCIHDLLAISDWRDARRMAIQGDASTRAYERLQKPDGASAILMISPPRPDGPVLRAGKSYSTLAHLAEDISAFVAIDRGLRDIGLSAPEIFALDRKAGVALIEDLGGEGIVDAQGPILERYRAALAVLVRLHAASLPEMLTFDDEPIYRISPYDIEALIVEAELLLDWYVPHVAHVTLNSGVKATFSNLWRHALRDVVAASPTWTLRDYHSPNLLWLAQRADIARVGIIDFQDCVLGHPAYDVVSLLQDARVDVPDETELRLLGHYAQLRKAADARFDMADFAGGYALLGAQRATKILGIFARLDKRDGKPHYLAHLKRIARYLAKDLAHPLLSDLRGWYAAHLPSLLTRG